MGSRTFYILIVIAALLFYLVGWQSISYNNNDRAIGSELYFTAPMVYLTGISGNFADNHIIKKYGNFITLKREMDTLKFWFPNVVAEDVPCNERFVVQSVFDITSWGILTKATKPSIKYYVVKSRNRKISVVMEWAYDAYTTSAEYSMGAAICPDPFSR